MQDSCKGGSRAVAAWGLALVALGAALDTQAAVVTVASRAAIAGPTTTVDWSALGGDANAVGASAVVGDVTVTGAPAFTLFQQAPTGSWNGNFLDGETILSMFDLSTGDVNGVFDISLASAVSGFGTQVQDFLFGPFSVNVQLFDAASSLLGSFDFLNGDSTPSGDGSALFVGFQSDTANISRVVISGLSSGSGINQITLGPSATVNPVSAPGTLLLVLAGLALMRRHGPQRP